MTCKSSCQSTYDFVITRGSSFSRVLRWEAPPFAYKPISAITKAAPARITATAHGLPAGWRVAVVSAKGMTQINARNNPPKLDEYHQATVVDANTVELNKVNASEYTTYVSGGYLQYLTPVDLTDYEAALTIKDRIGGAVLLSLTTGNGGIVINNTLKTITIVITALASAAFTWVNAVYDMDLISPGGVSTPFPSGTFTVEQE